MMESTPLKIRHLKFKHESVQQRYWYQNDPLKTIYANTLTLTVPQAERFIIACVRASFKDIKDKAMRREVLLFIKQETLHCYEHLRLFRHYVKPYYPRLKYRRNALHRISILIAVLIGKKLRLSVVAAAEHLTAAMSETYILNPHLLEGMDASIKRLWLWHFLEELEHRHVAFNLLKPAQCGYLRRIMGLGITALFFMTCFVTTFIHMMTYDKLIWRRSFYGQFRHFWQSHSIIIKALFKAALLYLKPSYHPLNTDDDDLKASWQRVRMDIERII